MTKSRRQLKRSHQRLVSSVKSVGLLLKKGCENESDRGLVITTVSAIEEMLYALLRKKLVIPMSKEDPLVDGPTAPASTFYSKLLLARSLGLISNQLFNDLNKLRELRNTFAHNIRNISFSAPEVKASIRSFDHMHKHMCAPNQFPKERGRFIALGMMFMAMLHEKRLRIKKIQKHNEESLYVWSKTLEIIGERLELEEKNVES